MGTEQRLGPRLEAALPASLQVGEVTSSGEITNVGAWGVFYASAADLGIGSEGVLVRDGSKGVRVRIAWKNEEGCGLIFVEPKNV